MKPELIAVGDTLELRLEASTGKIPFTTWQNQVFGLFDESGQLLLFGADVRAFTLPMPDLSPLDLTLENLGPTLRS